MTDTNTKGDRNETEAWNIINAVWRKAEKVSDGWGKDPWNLADIIALDPAIGVLIAQVKTNSFPKKQRRHYLSRARMYVPESVEVEVWVRVDYEGWRAYRIHREPGTDDLRFEQFFRASSCDRDTTIEEYRDAVDYFPKDRSIYTKRSDWGLPGV